MGRQLPKSALTSPRTLADPRRSKLPLPLYLWCSTGVRTVRSFSTREVLTVEYKVNFLAPAWGEKLVARGEVLSAGRRLFVRKAEVVAVSAEGEESPCAALQQTVALAPA